MLTPDLPGISTPVINAAKKIFYRNNRPSLAESKSALISILSKKKNRTASKLNSNNSNKVNLAQSVSHLVNPKKKRHTTKKTTKVKNIGAVVAQLTNYTADDKAQSICAKVVADFTAEYHLALLENSALSSHLQVDQLKTILTKTNMRLGMHPKNTPPPEVLSKINLTIFNDLTHRKALGSTLFIHYMKHDLLLKAHILSSREFLFRLSNYERTLIETLYSYCIHSAADACLPVDAPPCMLNSFPAQKNAQTEITSSAEKLEQTTQQSHFLTLK